MTFDEWWEKNEFELSEYYEPCRRKVAKAAWETAKQEAVDKLDTGVTQ
jgi:hypothetical protein